MNTPSVYNVKPARTPAVDNAVLENKPDIGGDNLFGNVADSVNLVEIKTPVDFVPARYERNPPPAVYKFGGGRTFRGVFGKPSGNALPLAVFIVVKFPLAADFKTAKSLRRKLWCITVRHKRHMRIYPFIEFKHKLTFCPSDVAAPEVVATDIGAALLKLHIAVRGVVGFKLARQSLKFTVFVDAPAIVFNTTA